MFNKINSEIADVFKKNLCFEKHLQVVQPVQKKSVPGPDFKLIIGLLDTG
jgi:hypothetical protein